MRTGHSFATAPSVDRSAAEGADDWRSSERAHVVYGWQPQRKRAPFLAERARGSHIWDQTGRRYLDLVSGQINVNIGYGHPHVLAAMSEQAGSLTYVAPSLATRPRIALAERIAGLTPPGLDRIFFTNGGSEAIENALKIARAATGRSKILAAWQSYHGATAGASAISGDARRLLVEPAMPGLGRFHVPGVYRSPFGLADPGQETDACTEALRRHVELEGPATIAALVLEPVVGTSGLYVPPARFLQAARDLCDEHGVVLIADETMSGWGRTGRWFACEHFDLVPDILTTAKGVTSGYAPLGVVAMTGAIADAFEDRPFVGGLTYEGHALGCAAGLANMDVYEGEGLVSRSAELGALLLSRLGALRERHACVGDVRGLGLFACIEFTSDRERRTSLASRWRKQKTLAEEVVSLFMERGMLVLARGDFLFIAPPLSIDLQDLDDAVETIDDVLFRIDEFSGQFEGGVL